VTSGKFNDVGFTRQMQSIELILVGLVGLLVCLSVIPVILRLNHRRMIASRGLSPAHRLRLPAPRFGGVALVGALLVVSVMVSFVERQYLWEHQRWLMLASALAVFAIGLWDDLVPLGARRKLLGQMVIASATYFGGIEIEQFRVPFTDHIVQLGFWGWPATVLWLLALTNLVNLIDGVDGLAGGICLMLMVLLVYVSWNSGLTGILASGMAGALVGFLYFNFPPARIYLGNGGTYLLGWLIGCETMLTSQKGTVFAALAAPLFVLALPIIDTGLAILRRGMHGLPIFHRDRKQVHHRLLASGYSRRSVVLGLYGFTAFFLFLGFLAFYSHGQYISLLLGIGTLVAILAAGRLNFSREWFFVGRVLGNSLQARTDIQYTMNLAQCLAMEGERANTLEELAESVVRIAQKLEFCSVKIRLEDDEKNWELTKTRDFARQTFKHPLDGNKYCFVELSVLEPETGNLTPAEKNRDPRLNTLSIQIELVAQAWNRAVAEWTQLHHLPARFDARPPGITAAPEVQTKIEFTMTKTK
jgi:UDP-GlcNAc:undecaprenyl-phosphate/decaprenyl-phosphate GlcNAc-1-phosphate transferase